ncbi:MULTISPECIES: zinc ribbon domain-containing protein [unclassified Corynebacterium]|uniref:zinc ribbon domain-containing protein n=1 Tax=unclassified Corynebacterium TaxID=2624378 RepID=UPI0029CA0F2A|nr:MULTISPECIES: C4-type zinc ribbon domain-containing protein [unclassified Corynebacterium]WPF65510.1 C4-type zinc ribbon domain-containing protein [Corynebacterium sp. 22KM0430]WPF68006.1 C4-type zinc ribbon domain-containing protein [Corynebacterium sp. 21KM1197]
MKLSNSEQRDLLELSTLLRSASVVGTRPQRSAEEEEVERLRAERQRLSTAAASARMAVEDMEAEILRIQEDERKLRKREREDKRELGATEDEERRRDLKHDLYSAKSRIADLMSELQEAHNEVHALRGNRDLHEDKLKDLAGRLEAAERAAAEHGAQAPQDDSEARIREIEAALGEDAVAEFQRQREENGVGAAAFNGRSCGGCFIVLPAADRSEIARTPADEVPQCPNCGSYLIRQGSSS